MFATLGREWELLDGKTKHFAKVAPGRYELEKIPNPFGHEASWLVLKGTMVGMTEEAWKQWRNGEGIHGKPVDWGEFEIIIEE